MKTETHTLFSELARALRLSFQVISNQELELASEHYVLRVREEFDRIQGVFVTIAKRGSPRQEIALSYLVEYRGGPPSDVEVTTRDDPKAICLLVDRYAGSLLLGKAHDFLEFENFARRKVEERFPETRLLRTNKWIRAEWVDDQR